MKAYFSHDEGARNDPKLLQVLRKLGHEGKSVYWDLVEMLHEQGGYLMRSQCDDYAFALHTSCDLIIRLVNEFDLFASDGEKFWSESALRRLAQRNAKSEKAKESAAKRWSNSERNANAMRTHSQRNAEAMLLKERKGNTTDVVAAAAPEALKANPAKQTAVALTDPEDEQPWQVGPLTKPTAFRVICERLGFLEVDFEHYRRQALVAAEDGNISRTIAQWSSWIRNYLNNQLKNGPLLKTALVDLTRPTPKHEYPPEGSDCTGRHIVLPNTGDANLNRVAAMTYTKYYPNATIHHTRP